MTNLAEDLKKLRLYAREQESARQQRIEALGWSYVSDHACPRKLAGKRCRNNYEYGTCWCCRHQFHLNDHGATWRAKDGTRFVLWEPYHAHSEDLATLAVAAHADGLRFDICESVWNPPHTVGIRFTAAADASPW
jgi:hypothetical protein